MNRTAREGLISLASLACMLCAAWPLMLLVRGASLVSFAVPGLALLALAGFGLRLREVRSLIILIVQSVIAALYVTGMLITQHVPFTPHGLSGLAQDANKAVSTSVAPLVDEVSILTTFLIAALAIGLVVDIIGATSRVPMLVALPITASFVLATMALGASLPVHYFSFAAISWALLLWACSPSWRPNLTTALTWMGMTTSAVVAALLISNVLPHRSTPALGRTSTMSGANTSVNFSSSLDLSKDLHSNNNSPILIYATSASDPGPIRVTVSENYADGKWTSDADKQPSTDRKSGVSIETPGFSTNVPSKFVQFQVSLDGMNPPLLPAPAPLVQADFGAGNKTFRTTNDTLVPLISRTPSNYTVSSRELLANARPLNNGSGAHDASVHPADLDISMLPPQARTRVATLGAKAGGNATTYFTKAVALQTYLRTNPQFTYSLTLAPTRTVDGVRLDPLSNFLDTHVGYCTQYATAMVMAARTMGIPARMAIGFLPGTLTKQGHVVRARDAHAWPELYFPGMGWTRFDPTPGSRSGSAPPYAPDPTSAGSSATTTSRAPARTSTSTAPASTSNAPLPTSSVATSTRYVAPIKHKTHQPWAFMSWVVGALLLIVFGLGFLPWAGRRERHRLLRAAHDETAHDEGSWHLMATTLADLGMPMTLGLSPRATTKQFLTTYECSPELTDAITRVGATMEQVRYAPTPPRSLASATERVIRTARSDASAGWRIRAALIPRSGLMWVQQHLPRR